MYISRVGMAPKSETKYYVSDLLGKDLYWYIGKVKYFTVIKVV
jgi:hypothetical protein